MKVSLDPHVVAWHRSSLYWLIDYLPEAAKNPGEKFLLKFTPDDFSAALTELESAIVELEVYPDSVYEGLGKPPIELPADTIITLDASVLIHLHRTGYNPDDDPEYTTRMNMRLHEAYLKQMQAGWPDLSQTEKLTALQNIFDLDAQLTQMRRR